MEGLFKWENAVNTAIFAAVTNIVLFSVLLEVPLFAYILSYGLLASFGLGIAARLMKGKTIWIFSNTKSGIIMNMAGGS